MAVNISALRTELLTDPTAIGYSAAIVTRDFNRLTDMLNTPGVNTVTVGTITSADLQRSVVAAEYLGLTAGQRNLWDVIIFTAVGGIALSNTLVRGQIGAVWSAGTTTRSNLSSLQVRSASRVEVLFGEGEAATVNAVDLALRS